MAFGFASRHLKVGERRSGTLVCVISVCVLTLTNLRPCPTRMKYFDHPLLQEFMKERLEPAFHNVSSLGFARSLEMVVDRPRPLTRYERFG